MITYNLCVAALIRVKYNPADFFGRYWLIFQLADFCDCMRLIALYKLMQCYSKIIWFPSQDKTYAEFAGHDGN